MISNRGPSELAAKWEEAWNSHDLDRILALYSEDVIFKSPRIRTVSGKESGVLRGKSAVRDYLCRIFDRRPDLNCYVDHVFAGVDSVALEYRRADPQPATAHKHAVRSARVSPGSPTFFQNKANSAVDCRQTVPGVEPGSGCRRAG